VPAAGRIRLDKWLWHARAFRTRALAAETVASGAVRVNGQRVVKPGHGVVPGDVLTFSQSGKVRVLRILEFGLRRGPAVEAQRLYADLDAATPAEGAD